MNGPSLNLDVVSIRLSDLTRFLDEYRKIWDCHMVDFIVENHFSNNLTLSFQQELRNLDESALPFLPSASLPVKQNSELSKLFEKSKNLSLREFIGLKNEEELTESSTIPKMIGLSPKKAHEVQKLSELVFEMSKERALSTIIDMGSGKGYLANTLVDKYGMSVVGIELGRGLKDSHKKQQRKSHNKCSSNPAGKNHTLQMCVTDSTNIQDIQGKVPENFDMTSVMICGLHSCGSLSIHALNLFLKSPEVHSFCVVGCCYNLVDYGDFPLSSCLKKLNFSLGDYGLMLAMQAAQKLAVNNTTLSRSNHWRACLQFILQKFEIMPNEELKMGKLASKCSNFSEYCVKAFEKLAIASDKLPNTETIHELEIELEYHWGLLQSYQSMRTLFSSHIESVILLDRVSYLLEQTPLLSRVSLIPVFDSTISPRCFAILAFK